MNLIVLAIPVFFLLIGIELLIQYFTERKIYRLNDALTNISCGILSQLSGLVFKVLSFGAYVALFEYFRLFTIESSWYSWIILLLGVDFLYYWAHRMSHEINLFWGGHVVHHQSEDYNFSVALRQSSFQVIWTFAFFLPLAILGFNPVDFLLINAITTLYQFWIHTEMIGTLGPLEYVFNTPSHHRVHHGKDPKYIDRNHAGMLIIWDKMFGTFQKEEEKPVYGITNPLNSWNPLWANIEHYARMYKEMGSIKGAKDKLRYLFKKPGWLPNNQGGYRAPKEINKLQYKKYDAQSGSGIHRYILAQFIIVLLITSFLLFNVSNFSQVLAWSIGIWIIISAVTLGSLIESKRWSYYLEVLRNLLLLAYGIFLLFSETSLFIPALSVVISLFSILIFIRLNHGKNPVPA